MSNRPCRGIDDARRGIRTACVAIAFICAAYAAIACGSNQTPRVGVSTSGISSERAAAAVGGNSSIAYLPDAIRSALEADARPAVDRERDDLYRGGDLLVFLGIKQASRVFEIGAEDGYFTELFARLVGDHGAVLAQNAPGSLSDASDRTWSRRLARFVSTAVRIDRAAVDPIPSDAHPLDLVVISSSYFSLTSEQRGAIDRAAFDALRAGGSYALIVRTRDLDGGVDARSLKESVEHAGFRRSSESEIGLGLRALPSSPKAAIRFAMKFVKL